MAIKKGTQIVLRKNKNCAQLFIYFKGIKQGFGTPLMFLKEAKVLDRNIILIQDPHNAYFQLGVRPEPGNFSELMAPLKKLIESLVGIEEIYVIGLSMGCFAALDCGIKLNATAVYCFSPSATQAGEMRFNTIERGRKVAGAMKTRDLKPDLMNHGCGEIKIYYSQGHTKDAATAKRLRDVPRLSLVAMPGDVHDPIITIRTHNLAGDLFPAFRRNDAIFSES